MHSMKVLLSFGLLMLLPMFNVQAQEATIMPSPQIVFISPDPGQALQGTVLVIVKINFETTSLVKLSFSYRDDPRDTWFLIQELESANEQELSFEWDTTTITDGDYILRLFTSTDEGEHIAYVPDLRVRNYSAVETNTPVPTSTPAPQDTQAPTATSTSTITPAPPTETMLPPNPAQITSNDIGKSIIKGTLITLSLFAIFGIYQFIRNRRRKKD